MKLRRRTLGEVKGKPKLQKALAIAILVKSRLDRTQTIRNYTIKKITELTGISSATIRKYMPIMKRMGLVMLCGKKNQHMVFKALESKTKNRNINISEFKIDCLQNTMRSIQAYIAISIQVKKEHIKRTIQISRNPSTLSEYKAAKEEVKRLVRSGCLSNDCQDYAEWGISYKRFAKELGVSIKTAFNVIAFAVKNGWLQKHKNVTQIFAPKTNYRNVEGYTFATKNNLYIVKANSYTLCECIIINNSYTIRKQSSHSPNIHCW